MACFDFDCGRAIRLLRIRIGLTRRAPTSLFPQCDRSAFAWTRNSDPAANKLRRSLLTGRQFQCQIGVTIKLGPNAPGKFGCEESALVLTTEQQWDCRENALVLPTDCPSCCGQLFAEQLFMVRTSFNSPSALIAVCGAIWQERRQ